MPKAIVLGAGMVGSIMAADLAADDDFDVAIADVNPAALDRASQKSGGRTRPIHADLSDPRKISQLVEPFDIVLGALASRLGFQTLRAVIEAGRNYCDISFMPEDAWTLDELAKARGVTAVVDCGVAPGMSNLLAGYAVSQLQECHRIEIYVGGLPRQPQWPFLYKAGFSPHDVIEEYLRPSRIVEHGEIVIKEALSEPELIDFAGVGALEAFNTDGLRSLAHSFQGRVPFMKEKTLRYPGHIELMRVLRHMGLFSDKEIQIAGEARVSGPRPRVRPLDITAALLFPLWTYQPGEEDLTVMRVIVEGQIAGAPRRFIWDLLDFYDRRSAATSMSRTTAFPCAIITRMLARDPLSVPTGVIPPELIGPIPGLLDHVLHEHERRGVRYTSQIL